MNTKGLLSYLPKMALAGSVLTFSFTAQADDVDYTVQKSSDLVQWTDVASNNGVATLDVSEAERQFVRLKVEAADSDGTVYACTKPEGYVTMEVGGRYTTKYFGVPIEAQALYRFTVASVTATSLELTDAAFDANQFSSTGSYWVRVISGQQEGRYLLIQSNTATTVTVDTTDGGFATFALNATAMPIAAGDIIEIAPADTLTSLFENIIQQGGLVVGTDPFDTDRIGVWNGVKWDAYYYYYNSANQEGEWRLESTDAPADPVLRPSQPLYLMARPDDAKAGTFVFSGSVPEQKAVLRTTGAGAAYTFARFPVDQTLNDFAYQGKTGWTTDDAGDFVDKIALFNQVRWDSYWKTTDGRWLKTGDTSGTDYSTLAIPAGTGVMVLREDSLRNEHTFTYQPLPYAPRD